MLNLLLLLVAGRSDGEVITKRLSKKMTHGNIISCNSEINNQPEMTILIKEDHFEKNIKDHLDASKFKLTEDYVDLYYKGYTRTIPGNELDITQNDECKFSHFYKLFESHQNFVKIYILSFDPVPSNSTWE